MKCDRASWALASALVMSLGLAGSSSASPVQDDLNWVGGRIQELQPTPKEKLFDEIGWARDIREAKRLAKENDRPVFLFTHDGRMNIGRC